MEEEGQLSKELVETQETPEDVRNKMAERLFALKEKREQERLDMVQAKNAIRFKNTTDELR